MDGRIVKGVTSHVHRLVVAATGAEARRIVVLPLDVAAELILRAQVVDLLDIRHAMVLVIVKACTVGTVKPVGSAHTGEAINHQHIALATCRLAQTQRLARETAAAIIHGDNAIGVQFVIVDAHAVLRSLYSGNLLERTVQTHTFTHDVTRGISIVAQVIVGGIPIEQIVALAALADGKVLDRQGLHHIGAMVALGDELQHTFIDSAAHIEAEHRVKAVFHIGEVLMRQQLHEHGGYLGHTRLIVTLVPHAAARPIGFPLGADVLDNLGREQVAVFAR